MLHILIEHYTATPGWAALPPEERNAFFARIGAGMLQFDAARITPLAMGRIALDVPPTVKVQDTDGKVVTTVRYPEEKK